MMFNHEISVPGDFSVGLGSQVAKRYKKNEESLRSRDVIHI